MNYTLPAACKCPDFAIVFLTREQTEVRKDSIAPVADLCFYCEK